MIEGNRRLLDMGGVVGGEVGSFESPIIEGARGSEKGRCIRCRVQRDKLLALFLVPN
jgi:hypothetical protein